MSFGPHPIPTWPYVTDELLGISFVFPCAPAAAASLLFFKHGWHIPASGLFSLLSERA